MRPLVATVDLSAIRHNYALAKRCAPQRQAFAVVKANAYGHGAREVVTALHDDADGFAVACLEEAAEVRALHASARILLLEGCFEASEYALAGQLRLDLVIQGAEQGEAFLAAGLDIPLNVWLKLDSGMHRLGFDPAALRLACAPAQPSWCARAEPDQPFRLRRRTQPSAHRAAAGEFPRPARPGFRPAQPGQFGGGADYPGRPHGLAAAGNHALRVDPAGRPERRRTGPEAGHEPGRAVDFTARGGRGRERRLRRHLDRRAAGADRHGQLRLR